MPDGDSQPLPAPQLSMNPTELDTRPMNRAKLHALSPELESFVSEPFYQVIGHELELFTAAARKKLPVLLKGPTGCGKTRFVEYMAWKLGRPLVTVACHDDLTSADLVGRYLLAGEETVWLDGPLTAAVRAGAICYLDEVVEARKDTTVVIHPLTDTRRVLPVEKRGDLVRAPDDFLLVVSYNPGYQSVLKELKQSTRQRFVALDFDYPPPALEAAIVARETGIGLEVAEQLVKLAGLTRNLKGQGLDEGASTRLLVHAGHLMAAGVAARDACQAAIGRALSDDADSVASVDDLIRAVF